MVFSGGKGVDRSRLVVPVAAAVAALLTAASPASGTSRTASAAVDPHGYPRTYHIYGAGTVDELARYDMSVGTAWWNVAGMRAKNPSGIFLLQPTLTTSAGTGQIHVTAPGVAAAAWPGGTDDQPGPVNLGTIRAVNQAWDLLRNADGSFTGGWNIADPTGKGTPGLVAKLFAYAAKQKGLYETAWNGVHSDEWVYTQIDSGWYYGPKLDTDRDGKVDDATTLRRNWANGLTLLGNNLRSYLPGKIVGGNGNWYRPQDYTGSDPDGWLKASNYTVMEHMQNYAWSTPDSFLAQTRRWLDYPDPLGATRYMAVLQDATDANGNQLPGVSNPNDAAVMLRPDVMKSMRWGLTLSLMTDVYYELTIDGLNSTSWWYDEFDGGTGIRQRGYLGKPLGGPSQLSAGVYRRDFDNGIALNNSSTAAQTIQLGGTFKKLQGTQNPSLNSGATVTTVTIPAHDGLILVRTTGGPPPPPPPPPPSGSNLALGKATTASSVYSSTYTAGKANDGSASTRWASAEGRDGEWWQVDLGSAQTVASVNINWEIAYASHYQIQTSTNGSTFTTVADVTNTSAGTKTTNFTPTSARYVRILGLTRGTPWGISIWEAQVFGDSSSSPSPPPPPPPPPSGSNLALGKATTASSVYSSTYTAGKANDGSASTRWASAEGRDGEWWQVDLGSAQTVASVNINWEIAYASHYQIQTSTNGSTFTTVADVTNTSAGTKTTNFTPTSARYVRILGLTRGTPWGISIWEAQVFGDSSSSPSPPPPPPPPPSGSNLALGKATTASSVYSSTYTAGKANDGSASTRWASAEGRDGEWWQVDLGSAQTVASVNINWEIAYASHYQIQTSTNGSTFTTVADVTNTSAGTKTTNFTPTSARYVRILGLTRGTPWGISIWEAQVFGS